CSAPGREQGQGEKGPGGGDEGEVQLLLEFKVDDIVDWLWEAMKLPNLKARVGPSEETDWTREGWDRHGARSRLDRRRSFKELVKRRGAPGATPTFIDEDLRYRQLARRRQPAVHAVVFFMLDVSGSMSDRDRKLAKTFFFWVVQGLRREYRSLETVFVAHTTEAWEFNEPDFFQVSGTGGTVASSGLAKVREIIDGRYNPGRCNLYLFYASDGDNSVSDAAAARRALRSRVPPGGLRGGARQLHDGDRRLRAAGAHAALVVRGALYLPADPAPHGALAALRGGLSRQPRPRLSRREQRARGEHPG